MTTPSPLNAATFAGDVRAVQEALKAQPNLAPGAETNRLFGQLVGMARMPLGGVPARKVMAEVGELGGLHTLCAQGEFALELHWANRVMAAAEPKAELRRFPYWDNYRKLAAMEVKAMRQVMPGMRRVLFVGSGPLPLSSYMMSVNHGLDVENVEIDHEATGCALAWLNPVLGERAIPCHHTDILDFTDFARFDVIVLAALVGLDKAGKAKVLAHLHAHMDAAQVLMVRSVRGLRGLLYPKVGAGDLTGFAVAKEVHPRGEVVNSVLLARKA